MCGTRECVCACECVWNQSPCTLIHSTFWQKHLPLHRLSWGESIRERDSASFDVFIVRRPNVNSISYTHTPIQAQNIDLFFCAAQRWRRRVLTTAAAAAVVSFAATQNNKINFRFSSVFTQLLISFYLWFCDECAVKARAHTDTPKTEPNRTDERCANFASGSAVTAVLSCTKWMEWSFAWVYVCVCVCSSECTKKVGISVCSLSFPWKSIQRRQFAIFFFSTSFKRFVRILDGVQYCMFKLRRNIIFELFFFSFGRTNERTNDFLLWLGMAMHERYKIAEIYYAMLSSNWSILVWRLEEKKSGQSNALAARFTLPDATIANTRFSANRLGINRNMQIDCRLRPLFAREFIAASVQFCMMCAHHDCD